MSPIPVSPRLRRLVIERAADRCEYCLLHQEDTPFTHQIDHVFPLKHGGATTSENLALACLDCNRYKGSDLSAIDPATGLVVQLYNPRTQTWRQHFQCDGAAIRGVTPSGRATVNLLRLNSSLRMLQRRALLDAGRYPEPNSS
ncbi:MAG: HNH endonuclease [Chloroflexi bacterium]|nr:HNH endonuclease [Chloroflexota bacterium]